jgi:hypothetical protein
MSINEEREEIITQQNTAQETLKNILEKSNRGSQLLRIREPLSGDLDLSILKENGFDVIQYISIEKGRVTSITGLPEDLQSLVCPGNLLTELTNLPVGLKDIDVEYNYLTTIDLSKLDQLEHANLSHNQLKTLEKLPSNLTTLLCDHNKLGRLDLNGVNHLETLNVSNNPITLIENLPKGISNFKMENTPSIEFRNFSEIPNPTGEIESSDDVLEKKDFKDALNIYFKLKTKYENDIYRMKKNIYSEEPNKKVAKKKMAEVKPKCIKCKRPVGTIFSNGKQKNRYSVICGDPDPNSKCDLNISIFTGTYTNLEYTLNLFKDEIDDVKDNIIQQKLDTLFNYVSEEESVKLFKKELQNYSENNTIYKSMLDKYNDLYNNREKSDAINNKLSNIFKLIEHNRELLQEYKKTQNREFLLTALNLQIKELAPEIRNLRMLKHEVMEMDEDTLVRYPNSLDKTENLSGEPPRVIKYIK